jgi:hypothetical protein
MTEFRQEIHSDDGGRTERRVERGTQNNTPVVHSLDYYWDNAAEAISDEKPAATRKPYERGHEFGRYRLKILGKMRHSESSSLNQVSSTLPADRDFVSFDFRRAEQLRSYTRNIRKR